MDDRLVTNASPLILLGRVEHLWLLEQMSRQIVVPQSVCLEIAAGQKRDGSCMFRKNKKPRPWGAGNRPPIPPPFFFIFLNYEVVAKIGRNTDLLPL